MPLSGVPSLGLKCIRGHHLLVGPLTPHAVVVDLGAHRGEFSTEVSRRTGCHCYAIEANAALCSRIGPLPLVDAYHLAVSDRDGPVRFEVAGNPERSRIIDGAAAGPSVSVVRGVRLETFLTERGVDSVDLLKLDVEGAEIAILRSLRDETLRKITQITVEFHDFDASLGSEVEALATIDRLKSLGFLGVVFSRRNHGDVLLLNRARLALTPFQWWYLEYAARYVTGIGRVTWRVLGLKSSPL